MTFLLPVSRIKTPDIYVALLAACTNSEVNLTISEPKPRPHSFFQILQSSERAGGTSLVSHGLCCMPSVKWYTCDINFHGTLSFD